MTKEELIEKLEIIYDHLDAIVSKVDDIYGTPLNELEELLNGKKLTYGVHSRTKIELDGLVVFSMNTQTELEDLIDELRENI